jgi:chromodomain-helicase-DNA-binding protein 1
MVLEYSIITTMDTSGLNVMKNGKKKQASSASADKISSEELQTILKFGAQNLFKQDNNGENKEEGASSGVEFSKLEEMNLDDILSRAEVHQGLEQSGTALGSAEFLTQFNVADVAQMSWDELIPSDFREEATVSADEIPEEFLLDARRRVTAPVNYKGADFSLETVKKKKKSASKNSKKKENEKMLSDKESRAVIRSLLKFGDWRRRQSDIMLDCDLSEKDPESVTLFIKGAVLACQEAVINHKPDASGKAKVISANYGPVIGMNSQLLLQRISDMEFLGNRLEKQNLNSFRITWQLKPVSNWSVSWGPKEDSMLLVGILKHGYGSWQQMQDDLELPFKKKFFLEPLDKALPGSIHLARRADYLLKALKEEEGKKAVSERSKISPGNKKPTPTPSSSKGKRQDSNEADESEYDSMDEDEYKTIFKPIKTTLRSLHNPSKSGLDKKKLAEFVRTNLISVGSFIRQYLSTLKEDLKLPKIKKHMWKYASYFWPRVISSRMYRDLCNRMTAEARSSLNATEKPKVMLANIKSDGIFS